MEKREYMELRERIYEDAIREMQGVAGSRLATTEKLEKIRAILKELEITLARIKRVED